MALHQARWGRGRSAVAEAIAGVSQGHMHTVRAPTRSVRRRRGGGDEGGEAEASDRDSCAATGDHDPLAGYWVDVVYHDIFGAQCVLFPLPAYMRVTWNVCRILFKQELENTVTGRNYCSGEGASGSRYGIGTCRSDGADSHQAVICWCDAQRLST